MSPRLTNLHSFRRLRTSKIPESELRAENKNSEDKREGKDP
jgi:hypothetical protein